MIVKLNPVPKQPTTVAIKYKSSPEELVQVPVGQKEIGVSDKAIKVLQLSVTNGLPTTLFEAKQEPTPIKKVETKKVETKTTPKATQTGTKK